MPFTFPPSFFYGVFFFFFWLNLLMVAGEALIFLQENSSKFKVLDRKTLTQNRPLPPRVLDHLHNFLPPPLCVVFYFFWWGGGGSNFCVKLSNRGMVMATTFKTHRFLLNHINCVLFVIIISISQVGVFLSNVKF